MNWPIDKTRYLERLRLFLPPTRPHSIDVRNVLTDPQTRLAREVHALTIDCNRVRTNTQTIPSHLWFSRLPNGVVHGRQDIVSSVMREKRSFARWRSDGPDITVRVSSSSAVDLVPFLRRRVFWLDESKARVWMSDASHTRPSLGIKSASMISECAMRARILSKEVIMVEKILSFHAASTIS